MSRGTSTFQIYLVHDLLEVSCTSIENNATTFYTASVNYISERDLYRMQN